MSHAPIRGVVQQSSGKKTRTPKKKRPNPAVQEAAEAKRQRRRERNLRWGQCARRAA